MPSPPLGESCAVKASEKGARYSQNSRCSHVIQAAIRVFAQKGFQGTKTREIAEAAGVNEALIFRDFRTKEKLYCAILEYASSRIDTQRWIEELAADAALNADDRLFRELALKILASFGAEPALFRLMLYCALEQHELSRKFRERQIEPLERFLEQYIQGRQQAGAFREADAHVFGRTFLNICHHYVMRQILFGNPENNDTSLESAAAECTSIFLDGIRSHAFRDS